MKYLLIKIKSKIEGECLFSGHDVIENLVDFICKDEDGHYKFIFDNKFNPDLLKRFTVSEIEAYILAETKAVEENNKKGLTNKRVDQHAYPYCQIALGYNAQYKIEELHFLDYDGKITFIFPIKLRSLELFEIGKYLDLFYQQRHNPTAIKKLGILLSASKILANQSLTERCFGFFKRSAITDLTKLLNVLDKIETDNIENLFLKYKTILTAAIKAGFKSKQIPTTLKLLWSDFNSFFPELSALYNASVTLHQIQDNCSSPMSLLPNEMLKNILDLTAEKSGIEQQDAKEILDRAYDAHHKLPRFSHS